MLLKINKKQPIEQSLKGQRNAMFKVQETPVILVICTVKIRTRFFFAQMAKSSKLIITFLELIRQIGICLKTS